MTIKQCLELEKLGINSVCEDGNVDIDKLKDEIFVRVEHIQYYANQLYAIFLDNQEYDYDQELEFDKLINNKFKKSCENLLYSIECINNPIFKKDKRFDNFK